MLNNKVQNFKSEFEKFMEGPNEKLKLGVGRRMYITYSFFIPTDMQNKMINIFSLICQKSKNLFMQYSMIEPPKLEDNGNTKVIIDIVIENVPLKEQDCFLKIADFFMSFKNTIDTIAIDTMPKSFSVSCSFQAKRLDKYNNILVNFEDEEDGKWYYSKVLPTSFSKYTLNVNYTFEAFKGIIFFKAYAGNVESIGMSETYFEIANNIISFNNDIVLNIKG
jgi:hypothetical protein